MSGKCDCRKLVLLCESDPIQADLQRTVMKQKFGLYVETVSSGREAFEKFIENRAKTCCDLKYKLVLMDANLPDDEGFEVTK